MFRVLALAGGGLRGAFAIGLLSEIEKRIDGELSDYFDLITGTSTGAITAASLCKGISAAEVEAFYDKHSEQIFHPRDPFKPRHYLRPVYPMLRWYLRLRGGQNLDHFFQSRYCPYRLAESMKDGFGDDTLADVTKCRLLIPAVNLTDGITCVFRTPHLPVQRAEYDWRVADVIVAACAAPTYFPHKRLPDGKKYADGGLWAVDPGIVGLSEAIRIMTSNGAARSEGFDTSRIRMLSIGTGQSTYSLSPPGADAGMLFWARHVAEVMTISQVQGTQLPLEIVLGDRYRQIDFPIEDEAWSIDNIQATQEWFRLGHERGESAYADLHELFFSEKTMPYRSS